MALATNKTNAKAGRRRRRRQRPARGVLRRGDQPSVPPPVVVKPVGGDNSLGITLVRDRGGYGAALNMAFAHSDGTLVESFVELGREVRCGIVVRDGELVCLPLEEYNVSSAAKPIRDYARPAGQGGKRALGQAS